MVSWLPHAVIPGLVALAFFRAAPRKAILMTLPIVWAVDADYAVQFLHRAVTHSVLWPTALLVAVAVLWRRRDPTAGFWEFATRPGAPATLSLLSYFWASHILLDVFQGGVVLLWPLDNTNVYLAYEILLDTGNNQFNPGAEGGTSEGAPALAPLYTWFSTEHTAILAFLAACAAVAGGVSAWWRLRGGGPKRPVLVQRAATLARPIQKP